ncbi:MAG: MFS transporter, partial [Acidobacteriota bacterium]|nr:MFS transporter [Acidobacteriota bacterium]
MAEADAAGALNAPQPGNGGSIRWLMISLAFLATVINYLDRQTLSVIAPVLRKQFHMTDVDYSRVVFAFLLAYTISNAVSGGFIDRVGTKAGYAICITWWSIASMLHALARGPVSLGVFRFLLGIGEAGNWPAGVKVATEWFPVRERALASGIFNSGSSIGAMLAPPVVAWIVLQFGWPASFVLVGTTGFLWVAVWLALYRSPPGAPRKPDQPAPLWRLARTPWMMRFTLSKVFSDPAWYFYIFWFPQYLSSARGFD